MQYLIVISLTLFGVSVVTLIHSWHYADFSKQTKFDISRYLSNNSDKWSLVHILAGGCGCSDFTINYLLKRGVAKESNEVVFIIDNDNFPIEQLRKAGFQVELVSSQNFLKSDEELSGVPLLLILDKKQRIQYAGGYDSKMVNVDTAFKDLHLLASLKNGEETKGLPAFGCIVANNYKKLLDPLGFKY